MNNNSDGSNMSDNSFNGRHMAELSREISGQRGNRDLGSDRDRETTTDVDYRYFLKILMERDRSPNSREGSSSRNRWTEDSREFRRDPERSRYRRRSGEWNSERDRSFSPYNYNAADLLNFFVDSNRSNPPLLPGYNNDTTSAMSTPWNINTVEGLTMNQLAVNQSASAAMSIPPPNIEMAQTNPNVNPMGTPWNVNPNDTMMMSQNNMALNQRSDFGMAPTSNLGDNRMNAPWNRNQMDNMTISQNNMTNYHNSSAMPMPPMPPNLDMAQASSNPINTPWNNHPLNQSNMAGNQQNTQTSYSRDKPKRTRWSNSTDSTAAAQMNKSDNSGKPAQSSNLKKIETSNPSILKTDGDNSSQGNVTVLQKLNPPLHEKEIIRLRSCVLYPPSPIAPPESRNEKPYGCKTIFVGNLPEKITQDIAMEVFERCGAVESLKIHLNKQSKKYFCHIRFFDGDSVETAMNLSGYRMKIDNRDGLAYSSRIHVDYKQSREDQIDYERKLYKSSAPEMTETSSVNSCGFMGEIAWPQYRKIPPRSINFKSPVKDAIIEFRRCILYPPDARAPPPITGEKPPGCNTVFVAGLPHEASTELLREIFVTCGNIRSIKSPGNNFCHIQFFDESSVDKAVYFSGYMMKIDHLGCCARLNVRYSLTNTINEKDSLREEDDIYASRPERHADIRYGEGEANRISEKLKCEDTFSRAAYVLINWLEKGACVKKTATRFYAMIQSTQNLVKKLQDDKVMYEENLNEAKSVFRKRMDANIQKFSEIEKIYKAACVQKCWDNFTKTQRKNLEMWKKQAEEIKNAHLEEVINEREDEEMELSEDENEADKTNDISLVKGQYKEYLQKLKEENKLLKSQIEAARCNELKAAQFAQEEIEIKDTQLSTIRTALQNSMKEVLDLNKKYSKAKAELKKLRATLGIKEDEENEDEDLSYDADDTSVSAPKDIKEDELKDNKDLLYVTDVIGTSASISIKEGEQSEDKDSLHEADDTAVSTSKCKKGGEENEGKDLSVDADDTDVSASKQVKEGEQNKDKGLSHDDTDVSASKEVKEGEQNKDKGLSHDDDDDTDVSASKRVKQGEQNKDKDLSHDDDEDTDVNDDDIDVSATKCLKEGEQNKDKALSHDTDVSISKCIKEGEQNENNDSLHDADDMAVSVPKCIKESEQNKDNDSSCDVDDMDVTVSECIKEDEQNEDTHSLQDAEDTDVSVSKFIKEGKQNENNDPLHDADDMAVSVSKCIKVSEQNKDNDSSHDVDDMDVTASEYIEEGEQNEDTHSLHDADDTGVSSSINLDSNINFENDVRLVSLISTFLIIQPFGATADYIFPYLHQVDSSLNVSDVESLMRRYPTLFKEEASDIESNAEKKWKFVGFQTFLTLS